MLKRWRARRKVRQLRLLTEAINENTRACLAVSEAQHTTLQQAMTDLLPGGGLGGKIQRP